MESVTKLNKNEIESLLYSNRSLIKQNKKFGLNETYEKIVFSETINVTFENYLPKDYLVIICYQSLNFMTKNQNQTSIDKFIDLDKQYMQILEKDEKIELNFKKIGKIQFFFNKKNIQKKNEFYKILKKIGIQLGLQSKYIKKENIGKGAFAEIHKIIRLKDNKVFAMKKYKNLNQDFVTKIIQDLRDLRIYDDRNIAKIEEIFFEDNCLIFVMELLSGGNLWDAMSEIYPSLVLPIIQQIISGLAKLHSLDIVHRDINPSNLMLKFAGVGPMDNICKIIDFELSRKSDLKNLTYKACGTKGFIAPEIYISKEWHKLDKDTKKKSDIFSLGILIYYLFEKKFPFKKNDLKEIRNFQKFNFKESQVNYISPNLFKVVKKMLRINPKNRPSSKELLVCPLIFSEREKRKSLIDFVEGKESLKMGKNNNKNKNSNENMRVLWSSRGKEGKEVTNSLIFDNNHIFKMIDHKKKCKCSKEDEGCENCKELGYYRGCEGCEECGDCLEPEDVEDDEILLTSRPLIAHRIREEFEMDETDRLLRLEEGDKAQIPHTSRLESSMIFTRRIGKFFTKKL